jgi:exodeoxyribonuclease VII small subunit
MTDDPAPTASHDPSPTRSDDPSGERLDYEAAREQLLEVVRALEQGGTTLEESIALWERGERLAQVCQEWLDGARRRLDAVLAERDGP